jgi:hypothetical protein
MEACFGLIALLALALAAGTCRHLHELRREVDALRASAVTKGQLDDLRRTLDAVRDRACEGTNADWEGPTRAQLQAQVNALYQRMYKLEFLSGQTYAHVETLKEHMEIHCRNIEEIADKHNGAVARLNVQERHLARLLKELDPPSPVAFELPEDLFPASKPGKDG